MVYLNLKRFLFFTLTLMTFAIACGDSETAPSVPPIPGTPVEPDDSDPNPDPVTSDRTDFSGEIRDITSFELVEEMGIGWNLGNSFDVRSEDKTAWGNPHPTINQISTVREMGFKTLRIPVTWDHNQLSVSPYTIEASYLDRVKEVVNYGLANQMHVIINVHHDDWIVPTNQQAEQVGERLASLWTQAAEHFITYGDSLIFETMNEPRLMGSPEEWSGGTSEGRQVLNGLHDACVDAIRATGGNNEKRHIMISTYAASTNQSALDDLEIPNDDPNIIISQHSYFPWSFAGQEDGPSEWGTDAEKSALGNELDRIRNKWIVENNRPVILGEWGTTNKNNLSNRVAYCKYYAEASIERGMLPIIWDDGGNFGLLNRNNLSWRFPDIARAAVEADN